MCTAFVRKGKDIITGFNFDMNEGGMDYIPVIEEKRVFLGMRFPDMILNLLPEKQRPKNGIRLIQGVSDGGYAGGQLCNLRFTKAPTRYEKNMLTLDRLTDRFVTDKLGCEDTVKLLQKTDAMNVPSIQGLSGGGETLALHGLFVDPSGNVLFVEPGNGYAVIRENYFTVTNFSILEPPLDLDEEYFGMYGVDRYRKSLQILKNSTEDFSVQHGLRLLETVKQTGEWATRFSFVYSRNENTVYFCTEGDFDHIQVYPFGR